MEWPPYEKCYDASKTEDASDLHYPSFSPNAGNIFVTSFSCHFSSCPAKSCDPTVALTLQGCKHILSTPNHTWYFWCANGANACGSFFLLFLLCGRAVLPGAALQFRGLARQSCSVAVTVPPSPWDTAVHTVHTGSNFLEKRWRFETDPLLWTNYSLCLPLLNFPICRLKHLLLSLSLNLYQFSCYPQSIPFC